MYSIFNVSEFIINYSNKKNYFINLERLIQILYYVQIHYISNEDKKCFEDDFYVRNLRLTLDNIEKYYYKFRFSNIPPIEDFSIDDIDEEMIGTIIEYINDYSIADVRVIIGKQPPMLEAMMTKSKKINIDIIKSYFKPALNTSFKSSNNNFNTK